MPSEPRNKLIRIIPKLDIKNGLLIKGINLEGLRILGNSFDYAESYYKNGADEIFYLDNVASLYGTNNLSKYVKKSASKLFIPLMVGGGIKSLVEIEKMLRNGADRVSLNSAAINDISIVRDASKEFGSSTIVGLIEYTKIQKDYFITKCNSRDLIKVNPLTWAKKLEDAGCGEIILTSVNQEGTRQGFDLKMTKIISNTVKVPVIANGGAGSFEDIYDIINQTKISGVAIASFFHYNNLLKTDLGKIKIGNTDFIKKASFNNNKISIIKRLKRFLKQRKINVNL